MPRAGREGERRGEGSHDGEWGKGSLEGRGRGIPERARKGAPREPALVFPGASRGASFRAAPQGLIGVQVGENKGREPIPRSR